MMKKMINKEALAKAIRIEPCDRTISQTRLIANAASELKAFTVNASISDLEVDLMATFNQYRGMMGNPSAIEYLLNGSVDMDDMFGLNVRLARRWHFHEVMADIRKNVDLCEWNADHKDNVDEQQRRINHNHREAFYELITRQIAVKYHSLWEMDNLSAVAVDTLYTAGLLDGVTVENVDKWVYTPRSVSGVTAVSLLDRFADRDSGKLWRFGAESPIGLLLVAAKDAHRLMNKEVEHESATVIADGFEINLTPKPDVQWLVEGVIPKTVDPDSPYVGFLYGNSGTYKSFIATGICAAIARGADGAAGFAGLAKVKGEPGKVMYLSGEDSYGIRIRFEAEAGGVVPDCVRMNLNEMEAVFDKDGNFDPAIVRSVIDHEPDLIVMDTMNSLKLCDNNNSSASVSKMMHKLKELGTTVMVVHHTTKSGDSMEGSHAMTSNADFIMRTDIVEREDDIPVVDLSCGKLKNAAKFKPMRIELVEQGEALVCRNHSSYEEAREAEIDVVGFDGLIASLVRKAGGNGMTIAQIINHPEVKYTSSRQALIKKIDRGINASKPEWSGISKLSRQGFETKYILDSEYTG